MSKLGYVNLRGNAGNAEFVAAVTSALDQDLPVVANTMNIDRHRVFWLGPDEWLIVAARENTAELLTGLRQALLEQYAAVTDVSGGYVLLTLSGNRAREVLAKGSTLDFHPNVFPLGHCAQSSLAKAAVLIGNIDAEPTYEIIVGRSFSEYLSLWLQTAGDEFGVLYDEVDQA